MRIYIYLWTIITIFIGFEYWTINQHPHLSLIVLLQRVGIISPYITLSTQPGRWLSLWLGWLGMGFMIIMNIYSLRKRLDFMKNLGRLSHWLNFHIFCGILGPTLIFFHCGLKVRGLVAISFWSMIISFSSGIIGRYIFVQISTQKKELSQRAASSLEKLNTILEKSRTSVDPEKKQRILKSNLLRVGGHESQINKGLLIAFFSALQGDLRILLTSPPIPKHWPHIAKSYVLQYSLDTRKSYTLENFETMMGYWHTFHFPFAIFMYIAAVIHIISSLIFLGI